MKKIALLGLVALLGFSSCELNGEKMEPLPVELQLYSQNRFAHIMFMSLINQVEDLTKLIVDNPSGNTVPFGITLTPTYDENNVLNKLVIEYVEDSEKGRKGSMDVLFTGVPFSNNSTMTIIPNGLYLSGMEFLGDISITNHVDDKKVLSQDVVIDGGSLTDALKSSMKFSCNFKRILSEGNAETINDDFYIYSGYSRGLTTGNISYNVTIDIPLEIAIKSSFFSKGKVSMLPSGYDEAFTVEFGKSNYVNQVLLTYKGVSKLYLI